MKTCSDALKALFNQYRTGEKRTWYIADLYTVWLNSSERIDEMLSWRPYFSEDISYTNAKFGLGLYDKNRSDADDLKPLVRCACPPMEYFNWNDNDWTIEYFVRYAIPLFGDLGAGGTQFAVTDSTIIDDGASYLPNGGFTIGAVTSSYFQDFCFCTRRVGEAQTFRRARITGTSHGQFAFKHIAVSKQGKTIYGAYDGEIGFVYTLEDDEELAIPASAYMNISCTYGRVIMDEVRVSTVARYTSNFTVPTSQFTPDADTLVLLHLNGNLDDEGNITEALLGRKDFRSGEIYLYTGHDTDLTCGGNKYRHIAIQHGDIEESRGTETATMELTINYNPNDTIAPNDSRTWLRAFKDGIFDKAYISLDRLYSPTPWEYNMPNISTDYVLKSRFFGRMDVQEVRIDGATIQVKSPTDMLTRELPRNLVKPACLNHFGDFMCQLNPENYRVDTQALSGSAGNNVKISGSYANGTFNNGMIYCTSGNNAGQYSAIKSYANNTVVTYKPFTETIAVGDKFYILRGCDKTMKMCRDVYGNMVHFRGFPYLPCKNVLI